MPMQLLEKSTFPVTSEILKSLPDENYCTVVDYIANLGNKNTTYAHLDEEKVIKKTFRVINNWLILKENNINFILLKLDDYYNRKNNTEMIISNLFSNKKLNINIVDATPKKELGFRLNTAYINERKKELEKLKLEYGIK
ncbi:MAG: hypothetical protein ACYDIA_21785 [Candidatus Humimicrobiaceae bacterium]